MGDTIHTQISALGTIMGVWAHPDDETFMIGGLLALAAANGQSVVCVTATKGEQGVQDEQRWPHESLADTRAHELDEALKTLGIHNHHWLGYKDGCCCDASDDDAVTQLMALIDQHRPDTIITFAPDGLTGHDDHVAVSAWAHRAAQTHQTKPRVLCAVHTQEVYDAALGSLHERFDIYFNIDMPKLVAKHDCDLLLELPDNMLQKKLAALKAMPSQYEAFFAGISEQEAGLALETEGLVEATRWEDL